MSISHIMLQHVFFVSLPATPNFDILGICCIFDDFIFFKFYSYILNYSCSLAVVYFILLVLIFSNFSISLLYFSISALRQHICTLASTFHAITSLITGFGVIHSEWILGLFRLLAFVALVLKKVKVSFCFQLKTSQYHSFGVLELFLTLALSFCLSITILCLLLLAQLAARLSEFWSLELSDSAPRYFLWSSTNSLAELQSFVHLSLTYSICQWVIRNFNGLISLKSVLNYSNGTPLIWLD